MIVIQYGKEKLHVQNGLVEAETTDLIPIINLDFSRTTIFDLKEALLHWQQQLQNADKVLSEADEIKLILSGKVLSTPTTILQDLFEATPSTSSLHEKTLKITMIANPKTKETIEQLELEKAHQEEQLARQKQIKRKARSSQKTTNNNREKRPIIYGFQRITTLANLPNEAKAKEILQSLANDSGIAAVMQKYKFTVNELTELYPEGQVGVSDVCVMGLNQNHGQKILLRLRTDDLKGFRKYLSIKKVLYHELAHNLYSEHDSNFYMLMRQIEQDANDLAWEKTAGRSLLTAAQRERYIRREKRFEDEEDGEEEQTVFVLGGGEGRGGGPPADVSASRVAGEAALMRFHQFQRQQEAQRYNQYVASVTPTTSEQQQGDTEFIAERSNVEGKEQFQKQPAVDPESSSSSGGNSDTEEEKGGQSTMEEMDVVTDEVKNGSEEVQPLNTSIVDYVSPVTTTTVLPPPLEEMIVVEEVPSSSVSGTVPTPPSSSSTSSSSSGFHSLPTKKIAIAQTFGDSITMILADETLSATVEKLLMIQETIEKTLDQLVTSEAAYQQFVSVLQLFVNMIQNIQSHPGEEKYKRIKKNNKVFIRTVMQGGFDRLLPILYQTGFEESPLAGGAAEQQSTELCYRKNDTGLLYLVKSMLESIVNILN